MIDFIWRLRATLAYRRLARLDYRQAWQCAGTLVESREDHLYGPVEAVREDLTYWGE